MTLTATHGSVRIITKLYGPVTEARLARERKIIAHRAEMLDATPPKRPLFDLHPREDRWMEDLS